MSVGRYLVIPILVSVLLHAGVVAVMLVSWQDAPIKRPIQKPRYIEAKLVELKPKAKKASPKKVANKVDLTKKRREAERKKREEQKKRALIKKRKQEEARKKREDEAKRLLEQQALAARQEEERQRLEEQKALEKALEEEMGLLLEESYEEEAQSYVAAISDRIERNWSRPPSARKGMQCELLIQLVPTGQVVSVKVVKGSGNAAFDRSAEQAVKKVDRFPEISEMPTEVFERYYRQLRLVFNPQDLRQ